ncbi:MAG: DUF5686 and carboxypeptidase regulatory-like domain-containing protein [Saprospiraceae bacterium]
MKINDFFILDFLKKIISDFSLWTFVIVFVHPSFGQISGKIMDTNGSPLAYASVYQENTTHGTVCNELGEYEFMPQQNGTIVLHFQYVGYKKKTQTFQYRGSLMTQDVTLEEDFGLIEEMVITADREDPAYAIIRKAISKRSDYKHWFQSIEADLYVKGLVKILNAPEKLLGSELNDMDGILDSLRQGIIYLSESQSKYYYLFPDRTKEVMLNSKTSGTNSLFTANQFSWANIDIYNNYIQMARSVLSPIGDAALFYYKYTLINLNIDEKGRTIYKIKVEPKTQANPLLEGHIYIVGDTWNVHSLDVKIPGNSLKISFVDTLQFKQVFLPLPSGEWPLFSQTMLFKGSFLGITIGGNFTYIFSNYKINQNLSSVFASKESFKVEKDALKQDSVYWANYRPVPLTKEEVVDYRKKDSLQIIWNSKAYQDSIDRKSNKLNFSDIIFGYRYVNRFENTTFKIQDPLSFVRFNVVEGWNLNAYIQYVKEDSLTRSWEFNPLLVYGFSDRKLKPSLQIERKYNPELKGKFGLELGRRYTQYDEIEPILLRSNTWSSLFYRLNYIRLFEKNFLRLYHAKEWFNGFYAQTSLEYANRKPLEKQSDFSFFYLDRIFQKNQPNHAADEGVYREHDILKIGIDFNYSPGQTYSSYPNLRVRSPGKGPQFNVVHVFGFPTIKNANPFSTTKIRVFDAYVNTNQLGYFSYSVMWAGRLGHKPEFFQDYLHPLGNEWVIPDGNRQNMFQLLPFYTYSTNEYYFATHWKHHFNGFIMDKIPLLKKTSFKTLVSANHLYNPVQKNYFEVGVGIENILLAQLPLGSVEYFWSWSTSFPNNRGLIIKLTQIITN